MAARDYPKNYRGRNFKGTFRKGMIKNWWVGFTVASLAVMFGAISATVLENLHGYAILTSISISGILGGLGFLGSGLGAATVPAVFERLKRLKVGLITTAFAALVSVLLLLFSLVYSRIIILMEIGFFFFGFFGNAFWSMSLTSVTFYTDDPAKSGFATSMFSVVSNIGVSIVPVFLGSLFFARSSVDYAFIIAAGMVVIAALLSPFLIRSRGPPLKSG
jgi:MFS family permease